MRSSPSGNPIATIEEVRGLPTGKLLTSFWALTTILWSIFRPPQHTYGARVLLFQPAWLIRSLNNSLLWDQDLALCLASHAVYSYFADYWRFPNAGDLHWLNPEDGSMYIYHQVFSLLAICALFASGIVFRGRRLVNNSVETIHEQRIDDQVLPPLLLESRTTHSRLFPKKHSFSYSYLLVGIPVGVQGHMNRMLSVDSQERAWFHIDSADYLARGSSGSTLAEKLKAYLHAQGVTDRQYAYAYLVTAPRFLGYSFNPVSFWYLYDSDVQLKYMILEVNNTFDERRLYLLKGGEAEDDGLDGMAVPTTNGSSKAPKHMVFSDTWQKDFHVSPFNSRKGSYSLRAVDPVAAFETTGQVQIDNTIVLRSSKEHPKIVARIVSEGIPKDPSTSTATEKARFIAIWCWVGFATSPRIVWEASKLFFKQKLHVWYKPEITARSIGRSYTADEKHLETFFRAFLTTAVERSSKQLRVIYEPAHSEDGEIVIYSPGFTYEEDHRRTLSLRVRSPAFYSRFVHYRNASEAFETECLAGEEKNRTAYLEPVDLLSDLLEVIKEQTDTTAADSRLKAGSIIQRSRWSAMQRLRCPAALAAYPTTDAIHASVNDKVAGIHAFDAFVKKDFDDSDIYRRIATKLFLAERMGLGVPAILALLDIAVRVGLLLATYSYL
ncbi:hypothetical protein LTR78_001365 [Recurvomyces mirabilis]|uniref:DUF1365-domain-containing protein n=1 Tax=Recurvomyces mirabilis TaxID=574656 RepID=A0AAE0WW67_9PEZI|nr:hypothetical protein LTR78_001365 [Recurvomyces mirabilis]KAK5161342.1 hypothetical protein LTS14_001138 [Recurvomyces mirabilis]